MLGPILSEIQHLRSSERDPSGSNPLELRAVSRDSAWVWPTCQLRLVFGGHGAHGTSLWIARPLGEQRWGYLTSYLLYSDFSCRYSLNSPSRCSSRTFTFGHSESSIEK